MINIFKLRSLKLSEDEINKKHNQGEKITYSSSGVDIEKANNLIENIKYKMNRKQPVIPLDKKNNNYSHSYRKLVESKQN